MNDSLANLRLFVLNLEQQYSGYGSKVVVTGRFINSAASDYQALVRINTVHSFSEATGIDLLVQDLRARLPNLVESVSGEGSKLLPGLVLGDDSSVTDQLRKDMIYTSLSHLTAVSGANCSVIVVLLNVLFARFGRVWANLVAIMGLAGFVVLVGAEPSVQRAAAMAVIVLIGLAGGKRVKAVAALAFACLLLMLIEPWLATSIGFALSSAATASLILFQPRIASFLQKFLPVNVAALLAVPLAAQIGAQPVLLLLDDGISLVSIPANIFAAPLAPATTMSIGLVALILSYISIPIASILAIIAWIPAEIISRFSSYFAGLRAEHEFLTLPLVGGVFTALVTGMLLVSFLSSRRAFLGMRILFSTVVLSLLTLGLLGSARSEIAGGSDWVIAQCDVGQGDAVIIRSKGLTLLYDTGESPEMISNCLKTLRIDSLDVLAVSHFDKDHVGGVDALAGRVTKIFSTKSSAENLSIFQQLVTSGAKYFELGFGDKFMLGDFEVQVIYPRTVSGNGGNEDSLVLYFQGPFEILLLGDVGKVGQEEIMRQGLITNIDVLKVAHHGSKDFSEKLNERLLPKISLIGVGAKNNYGHPTAKLLDSLKKTGDSWVVRTDLHGLSLIYWRELNFHVWSSR
ncbi:MAG: DNA internalization-related competence protein ComEC/Rec2 [Microbacteriaceae bacterium]|nr:DNA internalization-related competence protein ComEC/Rec2 [Microbacteriaceae bacterium]